MAGGLWILRPESQDRQSVKGRTLRGVGGGAARKGKRELGIEAWREGKGLRVTGGMSGGGPLDSET